MAKAEVLAVVFDFDDTLAPDSSSQLLESCGFQPKDFWASAQQLVKSGYDPTLAWLNLFLDNIGADKPLGLLTNGYLREFGSQLDDTFYPGVPELFDELRETVESSKAKDVSIEFFIISGGLREVILGTKIASQFSGIYGCELDCGDDSSVLRRVKRAVTFTEKTRYIYEIHKGVSEEESRENALLVNRDVKAEDRRIPGKNMIYVGDGLTDIPAFSVIENTLNGYAIGVLDRRRKDKGKTAMYELFAPRRVRGLYAPRYREEDDLGTVLRLAVESRVAEIQLERKRAYS